MDTTAYLTSQGWLGTGHALHYSGRGITKPIVLLQKQNVLGLGKKKHDAHADQWWARAFDDTLKGINATKDENSGKTEGIQLGAGAQALQMVGTHGARWVRQRGLYGNFVRGEGLGGTLTPEDKFELNGFKKRKRGEGYDQRIEEGREVEAEEALKKGRNQRHENAGGPASDVVICDSMQDTNETSETETKEQRRQRRKERRERKIRKNQDAEVVVPDQKVVSASEKLPKAGKHKKKKQNLEATNFAKVAHSTTAEAAVDAKFKVAKKKRR